MYTKKWYMVSMLPKPARSTYDLNSDVVVDCGVGGKDEVEARVVVWVFICNNFSCS